MESKLENILASIADKLFLPVDVEYKNYLAVPLKVLVLLYFVYCLVISFPPFIASATTNNYPIPFMQAIAQDPDIWKIWLPYIAFVLETVFFLFIGGSVFSEWITAHSKEVIERYSAAVEVARRQEIIDTKNELESSIRDYYNLFRGVTLSNFVQRILHAFMISRNISNILSRGVTKINARFLFAKLAVSFPGGRYGLIAFVLFAALIQVKIGQMYLPNTG